MQVALPISKLVKIGLQRHHSIVQEHTCTVEVQDLQHYCHNIPTLHFS